MSGKSEFQALPMTLSEARARLRKLFRIREIIRELEEYGYSTSRLSEGYIAHHAPAPGSSPHEAEIVHRLDLEAAVAEEARALAKLRPEQQRFAELRWGHHWPYRAIALEMHRATSTAYNLERLTLVAFIRVLGCRPSTATAKKPGTFQQVEAGGVKIETTVRGGTA